MPTQPAESLQRVHITLYESDVTKINALFGDSIGLSKAVRSMVRNYLKKLDQKVTEAQEALSDE